MTNEEVYDRFFSDEEYETKNAPADTYSYRIGWNNALKRASIVIRDEIRLHGKWMLSPNWRGYCCSNCGANPLDTNIDTTRVKSKDVLKTCPFCRLCGAKMEADNEKTGM